MDDICESRILFDLYKYTNDSRYLKAINTTYLALTNTSRTNEGNFWHKKVYPNQVWLDGLYMANPFYLEYANNNTNAKALVNGKEMTIYDDILNQYKMVRKKYV
ncbi:MAG: glycoside hydrolase family 88 protein [Clostridium sp.]|nr:MAG: glycoside hydrolase family 88 protein [Clostridium sp.]